MATATCPKCVGVIEGSLEEITAHIKRCGGALKRKKKAVMAPAPLRVARVVETPRLPWEIRVPLMISSLNTSQYAHWSVYKKGKDQWSAALQLTLRQLIGARLRWSEWRFTRCWTPPRRELDWGNLVGGSKPLADCMIEMEIIVDDRPANFCCNYEQIRSSESCTIITLLRYGNERPADAVH
jgi:hypothetical protein